MSKPINRSQYRSVVVSTSGIVASEHPLASQAGAMILAQGGHAVDAAVAANAVMGVVCPMMCGIGGDLFAIVSDRDGKLHGVNASGWAPARLPQFLQAADVETMPQSGVHSITVPGAVAGWSLLLEQFGRVPLSRVLEAAIALADDGFPVAEITSEEWRNQVEFLQHDPEAAKTFLSNGRPMAVGQIFRNPDLAWAYRQIVNHGPESYYRGEIAQRLVAGLARRGSAFTEEDFSEFRAEWVHPISMTYRGWEVFEIPPNDAGIAALMMLNIMENFPIEASGHNTVDTLHVLIEAKKLAYADMQRHIADQRFVDVPVSAMLNKEYARERSRRIDPARAQALVAPGELPVHVSPPPRREAALRRGGSKLAEKGWPASEGGDTTYLCASDRDGNMASVIQSNFASFGSGVVAEGTGFPLHNRGALFTLDRQHPNVLASRKRPLHTIIPAIMSNGDTRIVFGIMGAWNQSLAHAQFVSNVVDHRMNIQAALEAPRFTKLTFEGCDVMLERRIPEAVQKGLAARGHEIEMQGDFCSLMGGGQAVMRKDEVNYGASDPRKDGAAVPEPVRKKE